MAKLSRKGLIAVVVAAVAVALAGGVAYFSLDGWAATAKTAAKTYAVFKDDRTLGSPAAPVVLIEYAAPSCPHCAHFDMTVLPQLKKDYIDRGKVLYVLRVFPIMPADGAVEALARCLPSEKYFSFIDFMFRAQPQWDPEYGATAVRENLVQLSDQFGINLDMFNRCLNDDSVSDRLNRVAQDGQMRYGIQSVPTVVLQGKALPPGEAMAYPHLKARIDALLAKN